MNIRQKQLKKKNILVGGYTLIEVVITLTITSIAFIAIYALFAKTMQSDAESRYEIVAASLAQEGIEIIKNKREKNEMDWAMWNPTDDGPIPRNSFSGLIAPLLNCNPTLDFGAGIYSFRCASNSNNMRYSNDPLILKYVEGCSSGCVGPVFERICTTIEIDTDVDGVVDSLRVVCTVQWDSLLLSGNKRSAKTETVLTDWQR